MTKYPCSGHTGECKFCKKKYGNPRKVMGTDLVEIDRISEKAIVDPCCKQCANNMAYAKKKFDHPDIAARFKTRIPKGDEI